MADNVKITKQINDLLKVRAGTLARMENSLSKQIALQKALCAAMECATEEAEELERQADKMKGALDGAADKAGDVGGEMDKAAKKGKKAGGVMSKLGGVMKMMMVGAAFAVGVVVKAYSALVTQLQEVHDEMVQVAQAHESIRGAFGDLATGSGKKAVESVKSMSASFGKFGVSLGFGFAAGAKAAAMAQEMMVGMGAAVELFNTQSADNRGEMILMAKGLGMTGEQMGGVLKHAKALGKDGYKYMSRVTDAVLKYSAAAGVTSKHVGADVADMAADIENFGGMTVEQMASASAAFRKLGLAAKDVAGLAKAFDGFQSSVKHTAKLNQVFGVHLDAVDMMKEQDLSKRLAMLREGFAKSGKSVENMVRTDKAYLAELTGLTAANVELAFSSKNRLLSEKELAKKMKAQKSPQEKQIDMLRRVAKSIEQVVVSLSEMGLASKGFFGAFTTGLKDGLFRFGKFSKLASQFGSTQKQIYNLGMKFAKMLTASGPGLAIMRALSDIITGMPARFEALLIPLRTLVEDLLSGDPATVRAGIGSFVDTVIDTFKDMFGGTSGMTQIGDTLLALWEGASAFFMDKVWPIIADLSGKVFNMLGKGLWAFVKAHPLIATGALLFLFRGAIGPFLMGAGSIFGTMGKGLGKIFKLNVGNKVPPVPMAGRSVLFFRGLRGMIRGLYSITRAFKPPMIAKAALGAAALGGLVTVGLLPLGLAIVGLGMLAKKAKIDINATANLVKAMALVMLAMTPMIAIAAGLGMLMASTPYGLIGVAVIGLGFAAVGALAAVLTGSMIPVIQALAQAAKDIPNPKSVEAVASALEKTVGAATNLMKSLAPIVKSLKPGLFEKNANAKFQENLNMFSALLEQIMGSLTSMIKLLVAQSELLGMSPAKIKAAEVLASLIGAVSGLMSTLSSPLQNLQETVKMSYMGPLLKAESTRVNTAAIGELAIFYQKIGPAIGTLIKEVIGGLLTSVSGKEAAVEKAGKAVIPMFEAIRNLMGSIRLLKNFGVKQADIADATKETEVIGLGIFFLKQFFDPTTKLNARLISLLDSIGAFHTKVSKRMGNKLEKVMDGFKKMLGSISAMMKLAGDFALAGADIPRTGIITTNMTNLHNIMKEIASTLFGSGGAAGGVMDDNFGMGDLKLYRDMNKTIGPIKRTMGATATGLKALSGTVNKIITALSKVGEAIAASGGSFAELRVQVDALRYTDFDVLFGGMVFTFKKMHRAFSASGIDDLSLGSVKDLEDFAVGLQPLTEVMGKVRDAITTMAAAMAGIKDEIGSVVLFGTELSTAAFGGGGRFGLGPPTAWERLNNDLVEISTTISTKLVETLGTTVAKTMTELKGAFALLRQQAFVVVDGSLLGMGTEAQWTTLTNGIEAVASKVWLLGVSVEDIKSWFDTIYQTVFGGEKAMGLGKKKIWKNLHEEVAAIAEIMSDKLAGSIDSLGSGMSAVSVQFTELLAVQSTFDGALGMGSPGDWQARTDAIAVMAGKALGMMHALRDVRNNFNQVYNVVFFGKKTLGLGKVKLWKNLVNDLKEVKDYAEDLSPVAWDLQDAFHALGRALVAVKQATKGKDGTAFGLGKKAEWEQLSAKIDASTKHMSTYMGKTAAMLKGMHATEIADAASEISRMIKNVDAIEDSLGDLKGIVKDINGHDISGMMLSLRTAFIELYDGFIAGSRNLGLGEAWEWQYLGDDLKSVTDVLPEILSKANTGFRKIMDKLTKIYGTVSAQDMYKIGHAFITMGDAFINIANAMGNVKEATDKLSSLNTSKVLKDLAKIFDDVHDVFFPASGVPNMGLGEADDIDKMANSLSRVAVSLSRLDPTVDNLSKAIASWVSRIPKIYSKIKNIDTSRLSLAMQEVGISHQFTGIGVTKPSDNVTIMVHVQMNSKDVAKATARTGFFALTSKGKSSTSDRRLKEDITLLGQSRSGINVYGFRYIGGEQYFQGVMAQELLESHPEAAGRGEDGYYYVFYDLIDVDFIPLAYSEVSAA